MAEAIVRGLLRSGVLKAEQIIAADVSAIRRSLFVHDMQVQAVESSRDVATAGPANLLLSVKPQQMGEALAGIARDLSPQTLIISIAAGISTGFIEKHLGESQAWRVIRTMPNTPMLVGEGMAALCRGKFATPQDLATAQRIFQCAARVIEVPETLMDAVTAVSGSGPAYFFYLVEQMIRAGTELGFSPQQARELAVQTALGAAKMLSASDESPEELRRRVTSPGGTTQAAISHLETAGAGEAMVEAVKAAARRSKELGT
jgi:pyrroline-5-carboxylate reductase